MDKPMRIQRKRSKNWRMPENTICVSRPSVFGNPFIVGNPSGYQFNDGGDETPMIAALSLEQCISLYSSMACGSLSPEMHPWGHAWMKRFNNARQHPTDAIKAALRGRNLACWCDLCEEHAEGKPLDVECPRCQPCHVDPLGKIAND